MVPCTELFQPVGFLLGSTNTRVTELTLGVSQPVRQLPEKGHIHTVHACRTYLIHSESLWLQRCMIGMCVYRRMCEYLNNLPSQHKESLPLSEDRLSHHLTVMKGLRCEAAVQQSTGIQELVHLNTTQQHSASKASVADLFKHECSL